MTLGAVYRQLYAPTQPRTRSFREYVNAANPRYVWYRHCDLLADTLQRVVDGEITRLMVFAPPRSGKSELFSRLLPGYFLERHPQDFVGLTSYAASLAFTLSRNARDYYERSGNTLSRSASGVEQWETEQGGGLWAAGVGGPITGKGCRLGIIDDPLKNAQEADSETTREHHKDWFRSTFYTRLEPDGAIVLGMCMTGDTPVLMPDGSERPLREIRAGDRVATYDDGALEISRILDHRSSGRDYIFSITTVGGRTVRANARHPFLVEENGELKWVRLKHLTTTHKIVTVRDSGASGRAKPAPLTNATSLRGAEDSACLITARKCEPMDIARRRITQGRGGIFVLRPDMASLARSTMRYWLRRMANAPFASSRPERMCEPTGAGSSAWITATIATELEDCCATTAISPSGTPSPQQPRSRWPNTSDFTTDQIARIEPAGIEEVFDVQVERTENFIANGLVSHNTRWHEDDLAGWQLALEESDDDEPERWTILNLPSFAEYEPPKFPVTCTVIPDWRQPGEVLNPARYPAEKVTKIKKKIGSRYFEALHQQRPTAAEGDVFKRAWWRWYTLPTHRIEGVRVLPPALQRVIQSWDMSFKDTDGSDFVSGQVWGQLHTDVFLLDRVNDRLDFVAACVALEAMVAKWPQARGKYVEDKANGSAVISALRRRIHGMVPVNPDGGKIARAYAVQPMVEAGQVYLPHPSIAPWVEDFIRQLAAFPRGVHDDDVDACTQALNILSRSMRAEAVDQPEENPSVIPAEMYAHTTERSRRPASRTNQQRRPVDGSYGIF